MSLIITSDAPDFSLPCTDGTVFRLHERQRGRYTVLYFYPKDFTSGCTIESCSYSENWHVFNDLDCDIFGISADAVATHLEFKKRYELKFELLSDPSYVVCKLYHAKVPFIPMIKRISYLIGPDLKILGKYENLIMAANHVKEMMDKLKHLHI